MHGQFRTGNRLALPEEDPELRIERVIENMKKYKDSKDVMLLLTAILNCQNEQNCRIIDKILITTMKKITSLPVDLDKFRSEFLRYVDYKRSYCGQN